MPQPAYTGHMETKSLTERARNTLHGCHLALQRHWPPTDDGPKRHKVGFSITEGQPGTAAEQEQQQYLESRILTHSGKVSAIWAEGERPHCRVMAQSNAF